MSQCINIDGSVLEGGGQILRNAVSLSAILGIPVRIMNIRAGRSKPGLAAQHLKGLQLVKQMCNARLKGASIGSTEIEFSPGKIRGGQYFADAQTAGAISLMLQVALPCALMADEHVTLDLKGGTNADMAPQIDYMDKVFKAALQKFNADFKLDIHRRGYYPRGGGHVTVEVSPVRQLDAVSITTRGELLGVKGWCFVAGVLPLKMAYEMRDGARDNLALAKVDIHCYKEDRNVARDNCNGIILCCETSTGCIIGTDALGRRGTSPREVGARPAKDLAEVLKMGACLDSHAQDQVIIYMALAAGKSEMRVGEVTLHTKTAIHIAELLAKTKFTIRADGDQNVIECTGLGFNNQNLAPE